MRNAKQIGVAEMKSKKFALSIIAVLLITMVALSGCGGSDEDKDKDAAKQQDKLESIMDKGKIVIAMEGDWEPWAYRDPSGERLGFDVDLGKEIAKKLGVGAEFVEADWDSIFEGLDQGKYDILLNGVEISEKRKEKYDFSKPYLYVRTGLIARKDDDSIKSFKDLKGKKTEDTPNTVYSSIASYYGAKDSASTDFNEIIKNIESGKTDATINAEVTYTSYMRGHPKANIKLASVTKKTGEIAIPMLKGKQNESFRKAINDAITQLKDEGVLKELSLNYFDTDATIVK